MQPSLPRALLLVSVLSLGILAGCSQQPSAARAGGAPVPRVKAETVALRPVGDSTDYLATLKSRNSSVLQPEVEGQITRIFVKSGDKVQEGQPLLEIDPRKQQAAFNSQEASRQSRYAALEFNRTELERKKQLFKAGVISKQDLDQQQSMFDVSKADVDALQAGVRQQEVQLRYYTVKAPAAGTVGDIPVRVGDRVTNSTIMTTIDRTNVLEAYISIPAEKSGLVRQGTPVEILREDGVPVRAAVTFISPRVDPENQLLLIKATVPNGEGRFRNDQTVHARVIWKQVPRPMLPVTALSRISGQTFAFVVADSNGKTVAQQRPVQLGEIIGNDYAVLDGLRQGDRVITTGVQMLVDGQAIVPES